MNMEILQEAYHQLQRDYIKAQNKLQDIGFALADAYSKMASQSKEECLNKLVDIWGRVE